MEGKIKDTIEIILNEEASLEEIKESLNNLYETFSKVTQIDGKLDKTDPGSILNEGEILSPRTSAGSILDYVGTTKFLRGIKKAIDYQLKISGGHKIKILFVSPGPYASNLLPLVPLYTDNQIEITLIDFHEISIRGIKSLITHFNFDKYFGDLLAINPIEYHGKSNHHFNLIIIDNIQKGLFKEPQVAYTNHFTEFLAHDGTLIPEEIKISAVIANLQNEIVYSNNKWIRFWSNIKRKINVDKRIFLDNIFILDKDIHSRYDLTKLSDNQIILSSLMIPKKIGHMSNLILTTEIKIFDNVILCENDDTGLVKVYYDKNVPPIDPEMRINFSYQLDFNPRFIIELNVP